MSAPQRPGGQVAIALTVALLGFLLATQLRAHQGLADRLRIERESDLGQILTQLTARNDQLVEDILELRVKLAATAGTQAQERELEEDARARLVALQVMLGIIPVSGEGIELTIIDPEGTIGPEIALDTIQELRDAGAEALEVGGVRVVVSTPVGGEPGKVRVGNAVLSPPYRIVAIGSAQTLAEAMRIPGGVVSAIGARSGASVRIDERKSVSILSVSRAPTFVHARPADRR